MIRLFKNLQIIRTFSKKKKFIFYKKFGGAQAPLVIKWLHHCIGTEMRGCDL